MNRAKSHSRNQRFTIYIFTYGVGMKKILLLALLIPSLIISQTTYYSNNSTTDFNSLTGWGLNSDGSGSSPTVIDNSVILVLNHNKITSNIATIRSLTINNGAILQADHAITLNGTGATFTINSGGTYIHNNITASGSTIFNGTENFNSSSNFEIKAWQSSGSLQSNISFGNLTWNIASGTGNPNLGGGLTNIQGNFSISSTGSSGSLVLSGTTSYTLTIGGNLSITGGTLDFTNSTGTPSVNLYGNFIQTGGTIKSSGSLTTINFLSDSKSFTRSGGTLTNTNINWDINSSASLTLSNDLQVASSRTLSVNGILNCSTSNVTGAGTFTLASGGTLGIGSSDGITSSGSTGNIQTTTRNFSTSANYTYNSSSSQNTGNGLPSTVNCLTINNSSGVTLTNSTSVDGTLTLTSGNITTGSDTLTIGSSGSVSRSSGHVIGSLKKSLSSGTATFEVGTSNGYTPVSFANISGTGDFTVTTVSGKHPNAVGNNVLGMYWTLTNGGINSADLQFTYLDGDISGTESNYAIGKYSSGSWSFPSTSLNTTNNTASTSNVSSFSDFTLGEVSALPVELNMFAAKVKSNSVQLIWSTATEVNNYGFEIERKCSNGDWKKISFVQGHGNSNSPKNYTYSDQPLGDVAFKYRLKQVDFDGTFEYSHEIEVKLDEIKQFVLEQNYPNPFNPTTTIRFSLPVAAEVSISVFNLLGERVSLLINANLNEGYHEITFDGSSLTSGIYFYQLRAGDFKATKKFIIAK